MPQESTVKPGFWDISIGFSNFGVTTGTYSGQTGLSYNNTLGAGGSTCSTVYCHGNTLDGSNKTPTWTTTSTVACGDCHKNNAAAMASGALGSHARHAGNSSGQLALACTDCHGTNGSGGNGHVSGTVQLTYTGNSARFGAGANYNGNASGTIANVAPSGTYQSCSTVYCHSNAQGASGVGAPTAYNSPAWGGTAISCAGCHANMSGASGTGSHVTHANTYGMTCANCHTGYTASSTNGSLHANATINVDVAATYGGSYNGGTTAGDHAPGGGYGSCSTVYCHSSAQSSTGGALTGGDYKAVAWGSGALTCASCHNDMSAAGGTGSHELHASSTGQRPVRLLGLPRHRLQCVGCCDFDACKQDNQHFVHRECQHHFLYTGGRNTWRRLRHLFDERLPRLGNDDLGRQYRSSDLRKMSRFSGHRGAWFV